MWVFQLVGSKLVKIVAIALAAFLTLSIAIQYIKATERDRIDREVLTEQIETRERVDNGIRESQRANPDRNGSIALDRLRDRQSNN